MINHTEKWTLIVKIHNLTKALVIQSEELDPQHLFYFPIIIQQRDCLDHIIRAAYGWLHPDNLKKSKNAISDSKDYNGRQMEKALGHMYRAFFDAADWVSILYREKIGESMGNYSLNTIHTIFPNYYTKIVPRLEAISLAIAEVRASKDIVHTKEILTGVDQYMELIAELAIYMEEVQKTIPNLNKLEFGETKVNIKN